MKRSVLNRILILQLVIFTIVVFTPRIACAGITTLVSVASNGSQGEGFFHDISANGRYVAFESGADNLVPCDTNQWPDIFVYNRLTEKIERVSVASDGAQGKGGDWNYARCNPSISADGRYVAFASDEVNLVPEDTNLYMDIFVHDRLTGKTERVSVASNGKQGNMESLYPSISADGRYVAFESSASNLISGDTNDCSDIFVRDRLTGRTKRVSVASNGTQGDAYSEYPSISADGRFVAFSSESYTLVPNDYNGWPDVFVHDRLTGKTERVSEEMTFMQGGGGGAPSISADGRYVAFVASTSYLPGCMRIGVDVYVRDRQTGQTERVSIATNGIQPNDDNREPSISADGRFVAFSSHASNLVSGDTNQCTDVFVHDRQTGQTERVSVASDGAQGNKWYKYAFGSLNPSISADGRFVSFTSWADNLVPGDTNGNSDIFVRDRLRSMDDLIGIDSSGEIWYSTNKADWINIPGIFNKLAVGDFNGDGSYDVAGLGSAGSVYYTTNRSTWTNIPGASLSLIAAGDLNGNGTDDLAGINPAGKVYYTYNKTNWVNIPGRLAYIAVGDLNKDGRDDLVGLNSAGKIYLSKDKATWERIPGTLASLVIGDLNGDGVDDIAGLNSAGKVYYTTNKGVLWRNIPGILARLEVGDLDGDGRDDLAGLTADGNLYYSTNKTTWLRISGIYASLTIGDLNGNWRDDIAVLGIDGSIWYTTDKSTWEKIPGDVYLTQLYCTR